MNSSWSLNLKILLVPSFELVCFEDEELCLQLCWHMLELNCCYWYCWCWYGYADMAQECGLYADLFTSKSRSDCQWENDVGISFFGNHLGTAKRVSTPISVHLEAQLLSRKGDMLVAYIIFSVKSQELCCLYWLGIWHSEVVNKRFGFLDMNWSAE